MLSKSKSKSKAKSKKQPPAGAGETIPTSHKFEDFIPKPVLDPLDGSGGKYEGSFPTDSTGNPFVHRVEKPVLRSTLESEGKLDGETADDFMDGEDFIVIPRSPSEEGSDGTPIKSRKRLAAEMSRDIPSPQELMRERATPWMANIDWDNCENVSQMLTKEIHAYAQFISPTPEEHETRRLIVQLIRNAITGDFPDAQLFTFGSFETRLYLPTGDIDLVVMSSIMEQYSSIKLLLSKLASSIRRARISHDVEIIAKAKVPIIKFVTSYGHISVDISVNRPGGVAASTMAKQFMEEIPAIRPLVLVIKNFLKQRNMNEVFSGGLGSYGILCLVTSFLQLHPKIRRSKIDPMDNLGVLLIEFFETYGKHFNYTDIGISLRNGGLYFRKRDRGWAAADRKSIGSILCIEDPRDPLNNVTSGSFAFHRVKQTFAGAFEVLTAELCLRDTERESKANGTYYSLRAEGSGDVGRSLLSGVTGITQEMMDRRREIIKLYRSDQLQKLLSPSPLLKTVHTESRRKAQDEDYSNHYYGIGDSDGSAHNSGGPSHFDSSDDSGRYNIESAQEKKKQKLSR